MCHKVFTRMINVVKRSIIMKTTIAIAFTLSVVSLAAFADIRTVDMEPGENWWGAATWS